MGGGWIGHARIIKADLFFFFLLFCENIGEKNTVRGYRGDFNLSLKQYILCISISDRAKE